MRTLLETADVDRAVLTELERRRQARRVLEAELRRRGEAVLRERRITDAGAPSEPAQ